MIAKEIGSGLTAKLHINIDACHQRAIKLRKSLQIIPGEMSKLLVYISLPVNFRKSATIKFKLRN